MHHFDMTIHIMSLYLDCPTINVCPCGAVDKGTDNQKDCRFKLRCDQRVVFLSKALYHITLSRKAGSSLQQTRNLVCTLNVTGSFEKRRGSLCVCDSTHLSYKGQPCVYPPMRRSTGKLTARYTVQYAIILRNHHIS